MRFMVMVKSTANMETGVVPSEHLIAEMAQFNEALVKAGILIAVEGLEPSARGARIKLAGASRTVVDGPFTETKDLIAGYWLWQVKSREEAIAWAKRCPNPMGSGEAELEIREVKDYCPALAPELRGRETRAVAHLHN